MPVFKEFINGITKKQCMEFGQVAALACIFFAIRFKSDHFVNAALVLSLITILMPILFYPFAVIWFGLSKLLSSVSPVIIMAFLFFLFVVPVGLYRRITGKDSLRLKQFKKGGQSVMTERNHTYTEADLLHTF